MRIKIHLIFYSDFLTFTVSFDILLVLYIYIIFLQHISYATSYIVLLYCTQVMYCTRLRYPKPVTKVSYFIPHLYIWCLGKNVKCKSISFYKALPSPAYTYKYIFIHIYFICHYISKKKHTEKMAKLYL